MASIYRADRKNGRENWYIKTCKTERKLFGVQQYYSFASKELAIEHANELGLDIGTNHNPAFPKRRYRDGFDPISELKELKRKNEILQEQVIMLTTLIKELKR
jgi:hypothetical protein